MLFIDLLFLIHFLDVSWLSHETFFCWFPWLLKTPGATGNSASSPGKPMELVSVPLVAFINVVNDQWSPAQSQQYHTNTKGFTTNINYSLIDIRYTGTFLPPPPIERDLSNFSSSDPFLKQKLKLRGGITPHTPPRNLHILWYFGQARFIGDQLLEYCVKLWRGPFSLEIGNWYILSIHILFRFDSLVTSYWIIVSNNEKVSFIGDWQLAYSFIFWPGPIHWRPASGVLCQIMKRSLSLETGNWHILSYFGQVRFNCDQLLDYCVK